MPSLQSRLPARVHRASATPAGLILCLAGLLAATQTAALAEPNPSGTWNVRGRDKAGIDWVAKLVLMPADPDEYPPTKFRGHFDWWGSNRVSGREYIPGASYDYKTRVLTMAGAQLENADPALTAAEYRIEMTEDAARLENGTWDGPNVVPGTWQARRPAEAEPPDPRGP
jgi:hypothetical protein